MTGSRVLGTVAGVVLVLLGVAGFLATGFEGWVEPHRDAAVLGVSLNPTQNLVHLALGAALLVAATARDAACRVVSAALGVLLLVVAAAGVWATDRPDVNLLGVDAGANLLHGVVGGLVLLVALDAWRRTRPAAGHARRR